MAPTSSSPLRLLVVDDHQPIQALMKAVFRGRDVVTDAAPDGETALQKLRRQHYDAILLDLMLPRLTGFEVIRQLRAYDPGALARVVVLTAASDRTLRDFSDGSLVCRVMRKPFDLAELVSVVLSCATGAADRPASASLQEQPV